MDTKMLSNYFYNIDLNGKDTYGMTPIISACNYGHNDVVELLFFKTLIFTPLTPVISTRFFTKKIESSNLRHLAVILVNIETKVDLFLIAYVLVSITIWIVARFSPYEWASPDPCEETAGLVFQNDFTLPNSFWFAIGTLMQQG